MEQISRRKTECKFCSVLVDKKKYVPNVNLHEICISKIKHLLLFCFCTIWKTNGSKVLFLLQLITVFFFAQRQQQKTFKDLERRSRSKTRSY